jgi:NADH-quinone oxidoreductase subunit A
MIADLLLSPPVALLVLLAAVGSTYLSMRLISIRKGGAPGQRKPYACGEEQTDVIQADYGQFFPFAFFFTILHVVALTVTTLPVENMGNYLMAVLYVAGAAVGLCILYRS